MEEDNKMLILKLPWLRHREESRNYEVYTVDISPDGKRIATGGLDGKIRIWSMDTVKKLCQNNNMTIDENDKIPIANMSRHTGSVTCVKFSPDGKYLASGSDDRILLIWKLDEEHIEERPIFGSHIVEKEHWTVVRRLVAHDNDIQDICWAPDSKILVTVGLDRSIIVWSGSTFEKLKRIDVNQSLVKGVIFDPANKYFATTSDDRTLKIFRYHKSGNISFALEHIVSEPFFASPLTTYFRRLSWSPDGQHIAAPNATNGPVSSVVIINRGNWDSNITLIGHDAPTEVVRFNPRLFQTTNGSNSDNGTNNKKNNNVESVLATAGQDKTLVIWSTSKARPILVAYEIVNKPITDMCWSPDGSMLVITSLDSTITVISFQSNELGVAIPLSQNMEQLHRYGVDKDSLEFPESVKQLLLEDKAKIEEKTRIENLNKRFDKPQVSSTAGGIVSSPSNTNIPAKTTTAISVTADNGTSKIQKDRITNNNEQLLKSSKVNVLIPKRKKDSVLNKPVTENNGKKRIIPTLISSPTKKKHETVSSATEMPHKATTTTTSTNIKTKKITESDIFKGVQEKIGFGSINIPRLGIYTLIMGTKERIRTSKYYQEDGKVTEEGNQLNNFNNLNQQTLIDTYTNNSDSDENNYIMTLNSKITPEKVWCDEPNTRYIENSSVIPDTDVVLSECGDVNKDFHVLEIRNGVERAIQFDKEALIENPTRVLGYSQGKKTLEFFIPEVILAVVGSVSCKCWCFATSNGSVYVISHYGRLILPRISIGHKAIKLIIEKSHLIILTERGLIYVWDLINLKSIHKNIPILPVLNNEPIQGHRVRINKTITHIGLASGKNHDITLQLTTTVGESVSTNYMWKSALGCWVLQEDV